MDGRARMIDANANRAREALRVMEDAARFVLDDADLCGRLKSLRHGLREALEEMRGAGFDEAALLAWRDTPADVGTGIGAQAEYRRAGVRGIVAAAGKRLGEALRVIEECAKVGQADGAGGGAARQVEALRYAAYEAEKRLVLAMGTGRGVQWRLCVLITEALCSHHPWEEVARQAIEGGADCLQLREKGLPDGELLRRARRLVQIAREHGSESRAASARPVAVVINDRADIAMLAGADGVHVGQEDLPVEQVRRLAGLSLLVGVSTSNLEQARRAVRDGADYCGVGPMFATRTKDKPVLAGPEYLAEYLRTEGVRDMPHLAIGGITPENVGVLVRAGCRGVAVSSAVCKMQRPAGACRALQEEFAPTHKWGGEEEASGS